MWSSFRYRLRALFRRDQMERDLADELQFHLDQVPPQARPDFGSLEQVKEIGRANRSIKRLVDPRDIAALAVYLASDAATMISGQSLPIDGDLQRS